MPDPRPPQFRSIFNALDRSSFRRRFHLRPKELRIVSDRGLATIRVHARDLIDRRISAAEPKNDGRQTPMRNHPVFVAQHATATCCRGCIEKWHHIPRGRELTAHEVEFIVDLVMAWIEREVDANADSETPDGKETIPHGSVD